MCIAIIRLAWPRAEIGRGVQNRRDQWCVNLLQIILRFVRPQVHFRKMLDYRCHVYGLASGMRFWFRGFRGRTLVPNSRLRLGPSLVFLWPRLPAPPLGPFLRLRLRRHITNTNSDVLTHHCQKASHGSWAIEVEGISIFNSILITVCQSLLNFMSAFSTKAN